MMRMEPGQCKHEDHSADICPADHPKLKTKLKVCQNCSCSHYTADCLRPPRCQLCRRFHSSEENCSTDSHPSGSGKDGAVGQPSGTTAGATASGSGQMTKPPQPNPVDRTVAEPWLKPGECRHIDHPARACPVDHPQQRPLDYKHATCLFCLGFDHHTSDCPNKRGTTDRPPQF